MDNPPWSNHALTAIADLLSVGRGRETFEHIWDLAPAPHLTAEHAADRTEVLETKDGLFLATPLM